MNIQRLQVLLNFLKTRVSEANFNLASWRKYADRAHTSNHDLHRCGTTACAVGWACAIPEFNSVGLKYQNENTNHFGGPTYKGNFSWKAVMLFFDLDEPSADYLFAPEYYPDGRNTQLFEVIVRLENFINEHVTPANIG